MPKTTCRHCGAPTIQVRMGRFDVEPIPYDPAAGIVGIVLSRTRGVLWADCARPEPQECYPEHRCELMNGRRP